MSEFWQGICIGWFLGCTVMWVYFAHSGLMRTREEYYAAKDQSS